MSHNPLTPELEKKAAELEGLRSKRAQVSSALDWHSTFDRAAAKKTGTKQQGRSDDIDERLTATRDQIAVATRQTTALRAKTEAGWDPRYWFSKERAEARSHLATHTRKLAELSTRQKELESKRDRLDNELKRTKRSIAKYDQFDEAAAKAELAALDADLAILQLEHDALADRKERLDRQLEGPVQGLTELQADLNRATADRSSLRSDAARLERDIKKANKLDKRLSAASDGRDRWEVHQECEDEFGDGSPRRVLGERRRTLNDARREISNLDRRITALERDVDKAEQRVSTIVARGTRDIRSIVIDGNNLCYQNGKFIGVAALRPLCLHLQEHYEVTLVFDASIRALLSGSADKNHWITDERLRERFPGATVHVVAASTQADEAILAAAGDPVVYVLSNDRFSDYRDKPAVRDKRLITHGILNGQILVHDLGISLPFGPQS